MKLFLISNMYPSADSPGFGIFVKNVVGGLQHNGIETVRKAVLKGRAVSLPGKIWKYLKLYSGIVAGFFSRYDAIYIHFPNQAMPVLKFLYTFRQPPVIINYHGEDLLYSDKCFHNKLGRATEAFCRKYAAGIVVPSAYYADIVRRRGIAADDRIIVSPSGGIAKDMFRPKAPEATVDSHDRPVHLGYVGRLEEGKGIREYLAVLRLLSERGIAYRATIIGYGSLMDMTRNYIDSNGFSDNVEIIPGVPQSELCSHYQSFDLLFFLSSQESLGLTGIESMACGTPVVGSAAGGIASYLVDRKNGYMIQDISDTEGIVKTVEEYMNAPRNERLAMYGNAVATGERYFSDIVCKRLAEDFKKLL